jgi:hypothetical protein
MNISARQLESILNQETPGVFGSTRWRKATLTYLFTHNPGFQYPVSINAGEKGLIFAYDESLFSNDV